jgi:dihydrofolate reductase
MSLDGCCGHEAFRPDDELHSYFAAELARADALLFGRVVYELMESTWRRPASGVWPEWMREWEQPFAESIDRAKKYVVSSTLRSVDWNSELLEGNLATAVQRLKNEPGDGLYVGGLTLPLALVELGLIDEYEFIVHPVVVGRGPTLFAGLARNLDLELIGRREFAAGAVALRYRPALRPSDQGDQAC